MSHANGNTIATYHDAANNYPTLQQIAGKDFLSHSDFEMIDADQVIDKLKDAFGADHAYESMLALADRRGTMELGSGLILHTTESFSCMQAELPSDDPAKTLPASAAPYWMVFDASTLPSPIQSAEELEDLLYS